MQNSNSSAVMTANPMLPVVLRLSLKNKWFEMTKSGIKREDYREITPYWIKRLVHNCSCLKNVENDNLNDKINECVLGGFKNFTQNTMTLGYPSNDNKERILKLEHKGIEVRAGNPEWGAMPNKLYFVILHGAVLHSR